MDYPDPGASSLNPYPTLNQPTWTTPAVPDAFAPHAEAGDELMQDAVGDGIAYDDAPEYRHIAEQFRAQHGDPSEQRRGWHFAGELRGHDDDRLDGEDMEGAPMANPYYDPGITERVGMDVNETGDEGSEGEDPSFDAALAEALGGSDLDDEMNSDDDGGTLADRGKSTRGRPRGRGRGRPRGSSRGRGRGRGGWKQLLKGTTHDPSLVRGRGRPRGKRVGPGAVKSRKTIRKEDPGPEFRKIQGQASDAFLRNDLQTALALAREAVHKNPEVFQAHSLLSDTLRAMGDQKSALSAMMTGATIAKDPDLWMHIAHQTIELSGSFMTRENYNQAVWCMGRALRYEKEDWDIRRQLRDLHLAMGDEHKAATETYKMLKIRPSDQENVKFFAELAMESVDPVDRTNACKAYEDIFAQSEELEAFGDAETQWTHLSRYVDLAEKTSREPQTIIAQIKRIARWFLGRKEDAFWDDCVNDDREFDLEQTRRAQVPEFCNSLTKDLDAYGEGMPLDIRVRMGLLRLRLANADEAMRHFDQIYVQRGDIADLYDLFYTIGDELRQHELWEPAVRFYEPIKEVEDELTDEYWMNLAACHRGMGAYKEAEACFKAVMQNDQAHLGSRLELAKMYVDNMGEAQKALEISDEVIKLGRRDLVRKERLPIPTDPEKISARKQKMLEKKRKIDEAEAAMDPKTAKKRKQNRDNVRAYRARLAEQRGKKSVASKEHDAALDELEAVAEDEEEEGEDSSDDDDDTGVVPRAVDDATTEPTIGIEGQTARPVTVDMEGQSTEREASPVFIPAGEGSFSAFRAIFGTEIERQEAERHEQMAVERARKRTEREQRREQGFTGRRRSTQTVAKIPANGKAYAELLRKEEDEKRYDEAQAVRVYASYATVQRLWHVVNDEKASDEEVFEWMDAARNMYHEFRTMKVFYPQRDRFRPFQGYHDRRKNLRRRERENKVIREAQDLRKRVQALRNTAARPDDANSNKSGSDSDSEIDDPTVDGRRDKAPPLDLDAPTDFHDIEFPVWHHIFTDLLLLDARQGDQDSCYDILENGLYNANVFYHNSELINTTHAASLCVALIFNDSERLTRTTRWFITRGNLRAGSTYQLLAAVSRLAHGDSSWFTAGPTQKFVLRSVKTIDWHQLPLDIRAQYEFGTQAGYFNKRGTMFKEAAKDGLDPGLLLNYGHIGSVASASSSSLPYYFRAFALKPDDPSVNLSIATIFVAGAMKRQTLNRHYEIHQGLSFLYRYYDLRVATGGALEKQEAEYNVARMWHALGLSYLAIPAYRKVLDLSKTVQAEKAFAQAEIDAKRRLRAEGRDGAATGDDVDEALELADSGVGNEDFALEAAYTLQGLYAIVGNMDEAKRITDEWLVM